MKSQISLEHAESLHTRGVNIERDRKSICLPENTNFVMWHRKMIPNPRTFIEKRGKSRYAAL